MSKQICFLEDGILDITRVWTFNTKARLNLRDRFLFPEDCRTLRNEAYRAQAQRVEALYDSFSEITQSIDDCYTGITRDGEDWQSPQDHEGAKSITYGDSAPVTFATRCPGAALNVSVLCRAIESLNDLSAYASHELGADCIVMPRAISPKGQDLLNNLITKYYAGTCRIAFEHTAEVLTEATNKKGRAGNKTVAAVQCAVQSPTVL